MKVAPRCHAREVSPDEAARMVRSGSWVKVTTAEASMRGLKRQQRWRRYASNRAAKGLKPLHLWVSPEIVAALDRSRLPGESRAEVVARLVQAHLGNAGESRTHTDADRGDSEIEQP